MKQTIIILAFVAWANAGYSNEQNYNLNKDIPILRLENNNNGEAGYNYAYETGDGKSAQEQGYLKDADTSAALGSYTFIAPDGQQVSISYTADENGFVPQGSHIPTPPPIPQEILEALEKNKIDEANGVFDDGQYRPEQSPHQRYNAQKDIKFKY